jgi:Tol biopolymer transport system component
MNRNRFIKRAALLGLVLLLSGLFLPRMASGQYFGRNKPSYRTFDFKVYQSPNFDLYHYFEDEEVIHRVAETFEKWYVRHKEMFRDTLQERNPIIIYATHPDFQQTSAISGTISIGTQGVTEALRNRVVLPILETNAQTDHVIGHELVHVFHFHALFKDDSLSLNSMRNLPLWLVEGMAEYFSIGSVDAHTSMIMRDAIHQEDFPDLKEMSRNYRYNPYRFGHSFVAFFGRTWGDSLIAPLYNETARYGYERALERVVGLGASTVSGLWKSALENHYRDLMADSARHVPVGRRIVSEETAGQMNLSPSISPDGKHIAFFSERDLVSIDLFLAEAETGHIIRKLSSSVRNMDIDGFNFFESVGSWSPDGREFAYVAVKQGVNQLVIVDVDRPRRTREIQVEGVPALNNPSWSPDGRYLVFSGLAGGRPDLYRLDLRTREVTNLTRDRYSYIHPSWSPDGRYLVVSTDRRQTSQEGMPVNLHFNLGLIDMEDPGAGVRVIDVFPGAENLNPHFSSGQDGLYFLSNRDGYRNLYFYDLASQKVYRMTDFYTGISGITHLSPAISVARQTGQIVYTHFQKGQYTIYSTRHEAFDPVEVDPLAIDMLPATLPPFERPTQPIVDRNLGTEPAVPLFPVDSFAEVPFQSRFQLTFIGNSGGVGVSTSRFGTGMAGGVSMLFSDITGDNQLFSALAVNGEIYDFGGQVGYLNQKSRFAWGVMASHIPYPFSYFRYADPAGFDMNLQLVMQRTFEDQVGAFAYFPFSTTRRLELNASMAWYYFRIDALNNYYLGGFLVGQEWERRLDAPPGFNLQRVSLAYVGDNSFFGMASPITGQRYRFGVEKYFGRVDMYSVTADYRRYFQFRPFTLAFRGVHYGRYGEQAQNDLFYPLFLGYPGWVRGYSYNTLSRVEDALDEKFTFDQLQGSRVLMGGLELRVPLTGPERLALISSNFLFTELAWFADAGVAWNEGGRVTLRTAEAYDEGKRFPVFSTGPSLRINLFGALILEPYYAFPIHTKGIGKGVWGLNFLPGW